MKLLRILGLLILAAGIGCLFFASYITEQVNAGKAQINQGEQAVSKGNQLFSFNPVAQQVGKSVTNPIQKKINEGKETIAHYEHMAEMFYTGGIIGIIVGGALFLFTFFCKGKKRR